MALTYSSVPIYVQFSRDKYIMDGPPEKLRRELEEELKLSSEEPRSHAWYHGAIPRQVQLFCALEEGEGCAIIMGYCLDYRGSVLSGCFCDLVYTCTVTTCLQYCSEVESCRE